MPAGEEDSGVHRELRWYCRSFHEFPRLPLRTRVALERHNHRVLRHHLTDQRPELVSWWSMAAMSVSLIEDVRRAGLPALGWVNNHWMLESSQLDQWLAAARRMPRLGRAVGALAGVPARVDLSAAARWIFCSEAMRDVALAEHRALADTGVLYQGHAPDFTPQAAQPWRGRLLYVGRIAESKGLGTLISAVTALPAVSLRIVGHAESAAEEARLREQAAEAGPRVRFEAALPRQELVEVYAQADAVVFPVEWLEPWGLVPLESMAVGRPVVATARGGSAEYLEHGRNALIFPVGDVDALREAIGQLAADPALRERLREGGLETARRFRQQSWTDAVVREHEAALAGQPTGVGTRSRRR